MHNLAQIGLGYNDDHLDESSDVQVSVIEEVAENVPVK